MTLCRLEFRRPRALGSHRMRYIDPDRVRTLRQERLITQRMLATRSGLSHSTIKSIERGDRVRRSFETIQRVGSALGVDASVLILGEDGSPSFGVAGGAPDQGDPGRPTLVVLPFENLTRSPEQQHAGAGFADDLARCIECWRFVEVVDPGFVDGRAAMSLEDLGRSLGARYVVHGAIEEWSPRLRARVRLSNTSTGGRIWTDLLDVPFDQAADCIDRIAQRVISEVGLAAQDRARRRPTGSGAAWDKALEATWHLHKFTEESHRRARLLYEEAIKLDANLVMAHYGLAFTHLLGFLAGWSSRESADEGLIGSAEEALRLDRHDPYARVAYGFACRHRRNRAEAVASFRYAVELNPSMAIAHAALAEQLAYSGEPDDALVHIERALRLSPHDVALWWFFYVKAAALFGAGRYQDAALAAARSRAELGTYPVAFGFLAAAYAQAGQLEQAQSLGREVQDRWPEISLAVVRAVLAEDDPDFVARFVEGLRIAGLPRGA